MKSDSDPWRHVAPPWTPCARRRARAVRRASPPRAGPGISGAFGPLPPRSSAARRQRPACPRHNVSRLLPGLGPGSGGRGGPRGALCRGGLLRGGRRRRRGRRHGAPPHPCRAARVRDRRRLRRGRGGGRSITCAATTRRRRWWSTMRCSPAAGRSRPARSTPCCAGASVGTLWMNRPWIYLDALEPMFAERLGRPRLARLLREAYGTLHVLDARTPAPERASRVGNTASAPRAPARRPCAPGGAAPPAGCAPRLQGPRPRPTRGRARLE